MSTKAIPDQTKVKDMLLKDFLEITPFLENVVEDTSPQLGGDLDLNGKNIDFPSTPNISDCLDEDDMVSDSNTKLATQQSIKAYIDTVASGKEDTITPQAHIIDADGTLADITTKFNTLLAQLETLGFLNTS